MLSKRWRQEPAVIRALSSMIHCWGTSARPGRSARASSSIRLVGPSPPRFAHSLVKLGSWCHHPPPVMSALRVRLAPQVGSSWMDFDTAFLPALVIGSRRNNRGMAKRSCDAVTMLDFFSCSSAQLSTSAGVYTYSFFSFSVLLFCIYKAPQTRVAIDLT
jgi:hypothetical protein